MKQYKNLAGKYEFPIGTKLRSKRGVILKVTDAANGCLFCYFKKKDECKKPEKYICMGNYRTDRKSVIFIKSKGE